MPNNQITAHMVVKNEDRFIWYAISSVLPYVGRFLIFDTGSTDKTVDIINSFGSKRIEFQSKIAEDAKDISDLRQEQIEKTESDWFWMVDGDEVYTKSLCKEIIEAVEKDGKKLEGIVVGRYDLLGDIYHYQDESVGTYDLFGRQGHFVLRLINKKNIPGLHMEGVYPYESYYDKDRQEVIHHLSSRFRFTSGRLFHAMYLPRSSQGTNLSTTFHRKKYKIELGHRFSDDILYPEVFTKKRPTFVPDVTNKRSVLYEIGACLITPIKMLKRKFKY